jgi:hypothetical protein
VYAGVQLQLVAVDNRVIAGQPEPLHLIWDKVILLNLKSESAQGQGAASAWQHKFPTCRQLGPGGISCCGHCLHSYT